MQANAELMNNMIDLMQAGRCPHRQLATSLPQLTSQEMRQLELASFLLSVSSDRSAPDGNFVSRLRKQLMDECSKLEPS